MSRHAKVFGHIMAGRSDSNVMFGDLCSLLTRLGFDLRVRGDHHIFTMTGVEEIINLQPKRGMGKAYQVKQIRNILAKYRLHLEE